VTPPGKRNSFDVWLAGICLSRVLNGLIFMTYAGALSVLRREWGMSAAQAGAIASGFQIGYAVSLVIFSAVADRISPKKVYLWSMFAAGVAGLGFALFARDFSSALLLHTLLGFSLGGTYTTGVMIIADQYEVRGRGMAVGFFIASTSLGYACSLALSGLALPVGGYKLSFLLTCIGPLFGWLVAWVTLRTTVVPAAVRQKGQKFTREVLANPRAMLLIWGYSFHNWELQGMWSWTPAFMASCLALAGVTGLQAAGSGASMAAFFHVMGLLASFSMGSLSDRLGRARVMLALALTSMLCSFLFGWSIGWPLALVIALGAIYAFSVLGDSPVFSAALTEEVDPAYLGSALGVRSLIGFGAGAVAPLAFGAVLDWTNPTASGQQIYATWGWAFSVLGLGGLGAVWATYRFAKNK
jgi:MFS family permease